MSLHMMSVHYVQGVFCAASPRNLHGMHWDPFVGIHCGSLRAGIGETSNYTILNNRLYYLHGPPGAIYSEQLLN